MNDDDEKLSNVPFTKSISPLTFIFIAFTDTTLILFSDIAPYDVIQLQHYFQTLKIAHMLSVLSKFYDALNLMNHPYKIQIY